MIVHPQEGRCSKTELAGLRKVLCWLEVASVLLSLPGCASLWWMFLSILQDMSVCLPSATRQQRDE